MLLSQYAGAHTMAVLKIQGIRDKIVMFGPLSHRHEGYNHRGPSSQGPGQFSFLSFLGLVNNQSLIILTDFCFPLCFFLSIVCQIFNITNNAYNVLTCVHSNNNVVQAPLPTNTHRLSQSCIASSHPPSLRFPRSHTH